MSRVPCSDVFLIKCLISKKKQKKKERSYSIYWLGLRYNDFFLFFFMFHEARRYTRLKARDNTRAILCRRRGNYIYELYC